MIFQHTIPPSYYLFVFSSTLFIYGLHRIVGIQKTYELEQKGRYQIVYQYKHHIQIYTVLSFIASTYFFFQLDRPVQFILILPAIISVLYTAPVFGNKKRLRDFNFVKIFLIAIVWAITTACIPAYLSNLNAILISLLSIERALFFLAITIPFDIRDENIDQQINVKTLVHSLGNTTSIILALFFLFISFSILLYLHLSNEISLSNLIGIGISYAITGLLIYRSKNKTSDYYFTGLLDGTMILVFVMIYLFTSVIVFN